MFDAARASLIWSGAPVEPTVAKTHHGLISAFSQHLIKTGKLPIELGRALNRAAELRLVADYSGNEVPVDKVQGIIEQSRSFVDRVCQELGSVDSDSPS